MVQIKAGTAPEKLMIYVIQPGMPSESVKASGFFAIHPVKGPVSFSSDWCICFQPAGSIVPELHISIMNPVLSLAFYWHYFGSRYCLTNQHFGRIIKPSNENSFIYNFSGYPLSCPFPGIIHGKSN